MNVLIAGATGNVGQACVKRYETVGWQVKAISTSDVDLTNWYSTDTFVHSLPAKYDLVVMAQGTQAKYLLKDLDHKSWFHIVGNNLESAASLTSALMNHNKIAPNGLVVYCSSIQATQPRAGRGAYAAAKAGLEGLSRAVAVELKDIHARTVTLRLGQMTAQMKGIEFDNETAQALRARCFLPWVSPESIADFIASLYRLTFITGEVIEITSGQALNVWE